MNDDGGKRIWSDFLQWWERMKEDWEWVTGAASILETTMSGHDFDRDTCVDHWVVSGKSRASFFSLRIRESISSTSSC